MISVQTLRKTFHDFVAVENISFGDAPWVVLPHLAVLILTAVILGWLAARAFKFD
jgi:hypothetical protein